MMRRALYISLIFTSFVLSVAQERGSDIRFRLAQSYEKAGDFEAALGVYRDLFQKDSSNFVLIESLKRCHLQLKQHAEVVALINHGLTLNPGDIGAMAQLGSTYILMADEKKAYDAWDRAIASDPASEITYRVVGSAITQSRLFAKAIEVYRLGRKNCRNPDLFTSDIAYLHGIMLNYRESTEEYLSLLRQTPSQLNYIQSRIAGFITRDEGLRVSTEVVQRAVSGDGNNVTFRRLLAWLYMEAKNFNGAYDTYDEIDRLTKARGTELFGFAERALREKGYGPASRAYSDVISGFPGFALMPNARFGLARCLEELDSAGAAGRDRVPFAGAERAYREVVSDYPGTEYAAQSLFRLAVIRYRKMGDPAAAVEDLRAVSRDYGRILTVATEARLMLGEIFIAMDRKDEAASILSELAGNVPYVGPHRERAALELAELHFYEGRYDSSLSILSGLLRNPGSDAANDGIALRMLISENRNEYPGALRRFARAQLLGRQNDPAGAIRLLDEVLADSGGAGLHDLCTYRKAGILETTGRADDAIVAYEGLIESFPESLFRDRALYNLGMIHETVKKDTARAIEEYRMILENYPGSIHANEARKRIRDLRGDNS